MLIERKNNNRLAIYFLYDKDGIVDEYVYYMLTELKKYVKDILVVVNGKLRVIDRERLSNFVSNVLVRENIGFDVWAYKDGLDYFGWDRLSEYDETILMNYTIFGPLYPFSDMFEKMDSMDLDFWGITKHHKVDFDCFNTCKYNYIPEHIQSSFLVIRKSLMTTVEYHKLWDEMPMINSYGESVGLYEAIFTKEFSEKGFKSAVYIDSSDLEGYTRYPLMMMCDELIINRKCPVMKLKSFSQDYYDILGDSVGSATRRAYEYIKNNLDYDEKMMWQHVLRVFDMCDIKNILHLNYILPQNYEIRPIENKSLKIALCMHLYFEDLIEESFSYALSMPEGSDLFITVVCDEMKTAVSNFIRNSYKVNKLFNNIKIIVIENRGRDVSSLLLGCAPYIREYDYVCYMHDKKTTQIKPFLAGVGFSEKCWKNNLASGVYVNNIINLFENNSCLGMIMPPPPNHGLFYMTCGMEWFSNLKNTMELHDKLGLNCPISSEKEPVAPLGTMFWFRPKAMRKLFDYEWSFDKFPKEPNKNDGTILHAVERIYPFVIQDAGYYCAWCMTDEFAELELNNTFFILREINKRILRIYPTNNLRDMTMKIEKLYGMRIQAKKYVLKELLYKALPRPIWNKGSKIFRMFVKRKEIIELR